MEKKDTGNARKIVAKKQSAAGRIINPPGKQITHEQLYNEIMDSYLETGNFFKSVGVVHSKYGNRVSQAQIKNACLMISEKAKEICENIFSEVFFKHSLIYSALARQFRTLGFGYGETKSLGGRERLLGLSDNESEEFVINNEFDLIQREQYDIKKLSEQDQIRLEQLLLKTKGINLIS